MSTQAPCHAVSRESRRGHQNPGTGVAGSSQLPSGCWELNHVLCEPWLQVTSPEFINTSALRNKLTVNASDQRHLFFLRFQSTVFNIVSTKSFRVPILAFILPGGLVAPFKVSSLDSFHQHSSLPSVQGFSPTTPRYKQLHPLKVLIRIEISWLSTHYTPS